MRVTSSVPRVGTLLNPLYSVGALSFVLSILAVGAAEPLDEVPPLIRTPEHVVVNRAGPTVAVPPVSSPSLFPSGVFSVPLVALGGAKPNELEKNALAAALGQYQASQDANRFSSITEFLTAYPNSAYAAALELNLGLNYLSSAYFSKALTAFQAAWSRSNALPDPKGRAIADRAFGELVHLHARLGHMTELETLFADVGDRQFTGPATELVAGARDGLGMMKVRPEDSFKCGPAALDRILANKDPALAHAPKIFAARSTVQGINLADIYKLSREVGLDLQMAKRAPGSALLFPAIIHWNVGHYAALIQNQNGIITVQDPTFGPSYAASVSAIDSEASGYFLVPSGALPSGWRAVPLQEAEGVWGKGQSNPGDPNQTKTTSKKVSPCSDPHGMTVVNAHAMVVSLNLTDIPVGYAPPVGPSVYFEATYNQREAAQPAIFNFSNLGPKWNSNWIAYISLVAVAYPVGNLSIIKYYPIVHLPGGGLESYVPPVLAVDSPLPIDRESHCQMSQTQDGAWVRTAPDGSKMVFGLLSGVAIPGKLIAPGGTADRTFDGYFLTRIIDPVGNSTNFTYDKPVVDSALAARLIAVSDSLNQVTTLAYSLTSDPLKITKIIDPFGRFATFHYDANARLQKITDTVGISSEFGYQGTGDFITTLVTPYGTSRFAYGESSGNNAPALARWLEMTDPLGSTQRVEFPLASQFTQSAAPAGMAIAMHPHDVTYYWDKRSRGTGPPKLELAHQYYWLISADGLNNTSGTLAAEKEANENPVYYSYPGQTSPEKEGTSNSPIKVGRILDDGSSQVFQYTYNSLSKITQSIDPLGRETVYEYDANQVDLLRIKQKNGASYDVLGAFTYNGQHLPLTVTNAAGQVTTYTYTSAGQLRTVTNPKNETTTFWYHFTGQPAQNEALDPNAKGYLVKIDGAVAGATTLFAYDGFGRVRTTTDSQGYAVTTDYDAFDRPTVVTYPDATYEQFVYDKLDVGRRRDRSGRWTQNTYNALRQLVRVRDPLGRMTVFDWCGCGALNHIVDSNGNSTAWFYDLRGRVISKNYADGTITSYRYEATTSRLKSSTDAKGQTTNYQYNLDNTLKQVSYTNTAVPTASVSYAYDPFYSRVASMSDGVGTTTYAYNPVTTPPVFGAGKLASVTGPIAGAVVSYGYDELGRVVNRAINGAANTSTFHYDTLGRVDQVTNPLGVFNYGYVGATGRIDHVNYPNGQVTNYGYYPNTSAPPGNGDQRLQQIQNLRPGGANLSTFGYTYDAVGQIQSWSTKNDAAAALTSSFKYDAAGQLTEALVPSTASIIKSYVYRYDKAGNRTSEQIDSGVTAATANNVNQVTALSPTGPIRFAGTLNEPSTVTVNGVAASVDAANNFSADVPLAPGTQNVTVMAKDTSNNTTTKNYQVVVSNGVSRSLHYDQAGNETDNGAGQTYASDALNRLVKITQSSGVTEFVYDGNGRRVQEKLNGSVIKQWVWCDGIQPAEERDASGNVTKRFYSGLGEQIGGANYFYTTDHLGSIREMTDSTGVVRARYSFDPYGRITKVSGDLEADFGFTGFYRHQASGLSLTMYRAYDPELGRWPSRDPLGESAGINLYAFVANDPINRVDPLGLYEEDVHRDLTRSLAIRAGFSREEAVRIAGANQGVDDNSRTSPFASEDARRDFHFTTPERRDEMLKAANDAGSLDLFGQYLHAEQDSYAHQRGLTDRDGDPYGPKFGHLADGHDPDKTYLRPELALKMAEDSYQRLRGFYKRTHGCDHPDEWKQIEPFVNRIVRIKR